MEKTGIGRSAEMVHVFTRSVKTEVLISSLLLQGEQVLSKLNTLCM